MIGRLGGDTLCSAGAWWSAPYRWLAGPVTVSGPPARLAGVQGCGGGLLPFPPAQIAEAGDLRWQVTQPSPFSFS